MGLRRVLKEDTAPPWRPGTAGFLVPNNANQQKCLTSSILHKGFRSLGKTESLGRFFTVLVQGPFDVFSHQFRGVLFGSTQGINNFLAVRRVAERHGNIS